MCPFCPYNKVLYEPGLASRYTRCLQSEAKLVLSGLGGVKVSSVYFGGGTPLTLPEAVESLMGLMRPNLMPDAHVAVEVHPDDVTPVAVSRLTDAGVNMVSLGVESLSDEALKRLGRSHSSAAALAALDILVDNRRLSVNVDLMTGIPGQSLESAASDMLRLVEYGVDQVSAYPLMDFPFTHTRSRLSLRGQCRLLGALASVGSRGGYNRSSVWTWTKPGAPKYTSITRKNYVGIGAGAASHLGRCFWLNTFSVEAYVDAIMGGIPAVALSTCMSNQQSALYRLFWRCYEGDFDLQAPEAQAIPVLPRLVDVAERLGLASRSSSVVRLTDKGLFFYDMLERYYTRRYIGRLWVLCRASAFPASAIL
jgi:oxygen-independent coproporphyrinogen-3 oxidase